MTYPEIQRALDRHVLRYMDDHDYRGFDFWAFPLRCFVNEWITKDMARAICRSLTDRGYAAYHKGLWTEEGFPGGAGYAITAKGRAYLNEIDAEPLATATTPT